MGPTPPTVECRICPKLCHIAPGQSGECRVRVHIDGQLRAVTWGFPSALHIDPIEKKPLFHFKPGTPILSVATAGCNLHCDGCQNHDLSQGNPEAMDTHELPPADLVQLAIVRGCTSIAYTYSEPIVFFEYAFDSAKLARDKGLSNVLVTAGYANPGPARELFSVNDAANVDLKFFDDRLYRDVCGASLAPVLRFIVLAKQMGLWVELTHLVIPTLNDDDRMARKLCRWMVRELGAQTPLHLSRFSPRYKLKNLPPTPTATLVRLRELALAEGLHHVYIGNVPGVRGQSSFCPKDGTLLVGRQGYHITDYAIEGDGRCPTCRETIGGVWALPPGFGGAR